MVDMKQDCRWIGLGLLVLTASYTSYETEYFQNKMDEATMGMVGNRDGAPHKEERLSKGGIRWTYFEQASATTGYSGMTRGNLCQAYRLPFDKDTVLRDWNRDNCATNRHSR